MSNEQKQRAIDYHESKSLSSSRADLVCAVSGPNVDCAGVCFGSSVEDCAGECGGSAVVDSFELCGNNDSLQGAIDATAEGGTLNVPAGTYVGPFSIDKSLTLNGADQSTVFIENADISADVLRICYSSGAERCNYPKCNYSKWIIHLQ